MTTETLRTLNDEGVGRFADFLNRLRTGGNSPLPNDLLNNPDTSNELPMAVSVERKPGGLLFSNRFAFGSYLCERLAALDSRSISRNSGLWTWLALYYFDQLCLPDKNGVRRPLANEAYVLAKEFKFDSYYRHLVRTAWLAVLEHGNKSKVLLLPPGQPKGSPLGQRGEIIEQLAARQSMFGSQTIVSAAYKLYFDEETERPRRGSGGAGAGSPRRLALITQQLDLTFDLRACDVDRFIKLLPKEFNRWRQAEG
jgi:hypothetical protein